MRSSIRLGLVLISCSLVVAGVACSRRPVKLGADGLPVFEGRAFRHPSGDPFHCFDFVNNDGKRISMCREIDMWCAQSMRDVKAKGRSIVGECREVDEVTCMDVDGSATFCYATPDDCNLLRKGNYGDTGYASACVTIKRDFQPPQ